MGRVGSHSSQRCHISVVCVCTPACVYVRVCLCVCVSLALSLCIFVCGLPNLTKQQRGVCSPIRSFDCTGSCLLLNFKMVDEVTKKTLAQIPLLKTKAGPRDGEQWIQRLKEEYQSLIQVTFWPD